MAAAAASAALDPSNSTKNTLKLENVNLPLPLHCSPIFFWYAKADLNLLPRPKSVTH